ncbi:MAG: hypothetical protein HQL41_03170 [Alphaproteobacteria bacterium]|nr:hypothetical protein [Alphaproteobacteria bacterium]
MTGKLPNGEGLSPDALPFEVKTVKVIPFGNERISFVITRPVSWRIETISATTPNPSHASLKPVMLAVSQDGSGYLEVQVIKLKREITAANWLRQYVVEMRYDLRALETAAWNSANGLVSFTIDDQPFVGRLGALVHGDTLFLVFAFTVAANYEAWAEALGLIINSFRASATIERASVETHSVHDLAGKVSFHYPASWSVAPVKSSVRSVAAVDLRSVEKNGSMSGWIRLKAADKALPTRMELQLEEALEEFEEAGFLKEDLARNSGADVGGRFLSGFLRTYTGRSSENVPLELWITVVESVDLYVTASLLTPPRSEAFPLWAINRRAYEIICRSLQ